MIGMMNNHENIQKTVQVNRIYYDNAFFYEGRYLFLFGSAGSGKSYAGFQKIIFRCLNEEGHRFLVVRKYASTITSSVWNLCLDVLRDAGQYGNDNPDEDRVKVNITKRTIYFKDTGNEIVFKGVDDPEKIKSFQGVTGIIIEEATELNEEDFLQLDLRLRGETNNYKQIIAMFNPVSDKHWLVKHVEPQMLDQMPENVKEMKRSKNGKIWKFTTERKTKKGAVKKLETKVLNTTYHDNEFIDEDYQVVLERLASVSPLYNQVYNQGRWGHIVAGDLYTPTFDRTIHVTPCEYDPTLDLHYTVDFNVVPYMSGIVIQTEVIKNGEIWNGHKNYVVVRYLKEYALSDPKNMSFYLGEAFINDYSTHLDQKMFYLYGDASGNNRVGSLEMKSLFHGVKKGLKGYVRQAIERIPNRNPRYNAISKKSLGRKEFMNALFAGRYPVKIEIDPSCEKTIIDYEQCEQDEQGRLLKKKKTNKKGESYEVNGHHLQAGEYFFCHKDTFGKLAKI